MPSAILFDFNGVIIDDEPQHCEALIATLAEYGYALDRETYYREYLGFDDRECFRFTFARGPGRGGARAHRGGHRAEERALRAGDRRGHAAGAGRGRVRRAPPRTRAIASPSSPARFGGRSSWCSSSPDCDAHFGEIVAAEDVSACKPDPQGYQPRPRGAGAGRRTVRRDRGLPARPRRRARGRPALRDAHHLARRGRARRRRRRSGVTSSAGPARPSLGQWLTLDLTLDRDRLERVRQGAAVVLGSPGGLSRQRARARSPACRGCFTNDLEKPGDEQPGLRRAAHAEGHDRGRRLGRCARATAFTLVAPAGGRESVADHLPAQSPAPARPAARSTDGSAIAWILGDARFPHAGPVRHRRPRDRGAGGASEAPLAGGARARGRAVRRTGRRRDGGGRERGPPASARGGARAATRTTSTPPASWPAGPRWAPRSTRRPCRRKCATTRSAGYPTPRAATPDRRRSPASTSAVTPIASFAVSPGASRALPMGGACWPGTRRSARCARP